MTVNSLASGLGSSCGFGVESVYGTAVTPTNFIVATSIGLELDVEHIMSEGIVSGRSVQQSSRQVVNKKGVSGEIEFDAEANGMGLLLRHMMGDERAYGTTKTTVTLGVYSYAFRLGTLPTSSSLTFQVGAADRGGVVRTMNATGCVIPEWSIANEVDGTLATTLTVAGRDYVPSASDRTSISYATGTEPFTFAGGAATIDSTAAEVRSIELNVAQGLDLERYQIASSTLRSQPVLAEMREITGTIELEFGAGPGTWATSDMFTKYRAGSVIAVTATWTGATAISGTYYPSISFTMPKCLITSATPTVEGPGMLMQSIEFQALEDNASSTEALTCTYVSSESLS